MRPTSEINQDIKKLMEENPGVFERYMGLASEFLDSADNERALLLVMQQEAGLLKLRITKH